MQDKPWAAAGKRGQRTAWWPQLLRRDRRL